MQEVFDRIKAEQADVIETGSAGSSADDEGAPRDTAGEQAAEA